MLRVRLTKYQQMHPDTALAAQQMFTSLFTYLLEALDKIKPYTAFPRIQPGSQIKPGSTYPSKLID